MDEPADDSPGAIDNKEKGGDFTHLLDEQLNRDLPAREPEAEATPVSAAVLPEPEEREVSPTPHAESEVPTPVVASIPKDDSGDDISAHLDDLFAGDGESAEPVAPAAPVVQTPPAQSQPVSETKPPAEPQAKPEVRPVPPPDPGKIDLPAAPAAKAPVAGSTETIKRNPNVIRPEALWKTTDLPTLGTDAKTKNRFWLIAACVGILLIGAGFMFLRGTEDPQAATTAATGGRPASKSMAVPATPPPVPRDSSGSDTVAAGMTPAAGDPTAASVGSAPGKTEPLKLDPATRPEPAKPAPAKAAPVKPAPVKTATVKSEPVKPAPVKTATVKAEPAKPASVKTATVKAAPAKPAASQPAPAKPAIPPVETKIEPPAATSAKPDEPEKTEPVPVETPTPRSEPVTIATPAVESSTPAPAKTTPVAVEPPVEEPAEAPKPAEVKPTPPPAPAEPVITQPELIERIEPTYPPKAKKRGERGTIVLNMLVSESGRIIRVVVEEGVPGSELEAAAVSAVLRWRFRPATEDGLPVRAWTTARFVFE